MSETQRQIVQECFDGDRERDCDYCPAHYSKTGICCFGHKYEDEDNQCVSCPHNYDCSMETAQHERERTVDRPRRIMINRGGSDRPSQRPGLPVYGQQRQQPPPSRSRPQADVGGLIQPSPHVAQHIARTRPPQIIEPVPNAEGFFKNMGLHAAWGAGEGMLEMLLGYMRHRRPL